MAQPTHGDAPGGGGALVPLRQWIESEAAGPQKNNNDVGGGGEQLQLREAAMLRKTTVAYGAAELVRHARSHPGAHPKNNSTASVNGLCEIDNFSVRLSKEKGASSKHITGVEMISPQLAVHIAEPSFLRSSFADTIDVDEEETAGRYLEVEFSSGGKLLPEEDGGGAVAVSQSEEDGRLRALGELFYRLFSHVSLGSASASSATNSEASGPARKKFKSRMAADGDNGESNSAGRPSARYVPLLELGFPSSIGLLVRNLLECEEDVREGRGDDAYDCLETLIKDLHLLLLDPKRFLFDEELIVGSDGTVSQLSFRKHRLYGRENEVSLITDAFCRVSCGKSEAFFIGGFSGSGKSILVNSLKARVNAAEGYVITGKFDQIAKERPLLDVISVFNELCLIVKERSSTHELEAIVDKLADVFGSDLSVLAGLIPNIAVLSPKLTPEGQDQKEGGDQRNLRSVCFTLQRFMRVVSSVAHPVMLFLDDLQWSDNSAMALVESILCDAVGSSCLFFVGSYRSNEVADGHDVFRFMSSVESAGVPTTKLSLEGLSPTDLNTMISDALCTFPRVCEPLSDIVYQKTKGNPYFVLEFLRSLVEGGLLTYSAQKKQWEWDEDRISSMDVTGNVLYLLSSKMSGLSDTIQSSLKVAACFGIKIPGSIVGYLGAKPEYSHIREGLDQAVQQGFMIKVGSSFDCRFVHDKVREAAYSLIPDEEKKQFHYSLGMILYSMTKGSDINGVVFSIVDQINHGIGLMSADDPASRIDIAELNETAAVKAVDRSDFGTARSYSNVALSLLPIDCWKSHYDLTRRLSFLLAKSSYSSGDVEKARSILKEMLEKCHSIEDKLDAYYLLATVLHSCGEGKDAYSTCHEVLSELHEDIPESVDNDAMATIFAETAKSAQSITEESLLAMEQMDDKLSITLKFYSLFAEVAFFSKPKMYALLTCRMVLLTMKYGICEYSPGGFVGFANILCGGKMNDIPGAARIGRASMACMKKRFQSTEQTARYVANYGVVAHWCEPLQTLSSMISQAFDAGMSTGNSQAAFLNSIQHIKVAIIAGEKLPVLLKKVDYYLQLASAARSELTRSYLLIFRGTITMLIDRTPPSDSTPENGSNANLLETQFFHRALQAYWMGHSERCHHYIGKLQQMSSSAAHGRLSNVMMTFINGLNSFSVLKRTNTAKLRVIPKNAVMALRDAQTHSRWNFRNKAHLLEAENFSFHNNHEDAKASYAAAITSARCSRFVHEQGLACELAGLHYKKMGDIRSSMSFLTQAKACYTEWGSNVKVDSVARHLESFQSLRLVPGQVP
ncbi:hypothetical protein ACHAXT_012905 [Thalassiosira profunda]